MYCTQAGRRTPISIRQDSFKFSSRRTPISIRRTPISIITYPPDTQSVRTVRRTPISIITYPPDTQSGFSPEVVELLRELATERQNKLNKGEYEVTTWSARTWTSFVCQKISVALHRAAALEIAHAVGISHATDPRM